MITPNTLNKNDHIRLLCPASSLSDVSIAETTQKFLISKGFRVSVGKNIFKKQGFLAGSDEDRLDDLHEALWDPSVKGIFCVRGGYGSGRLLKDLNFAQIKKTKKILLGFSDITALQLGILSKVQLQSFHGPVYSLSKDKNFESLMHCASQKKKVFDLFPKEYLMRSHVVSPGNAEGILYGGNLSIICSLLGTPYFPRIKNGVLFIEDINEPSYRIDRMLTQLEYAGVLKSLSGVLVGQFTNCKSKDPSFKEVIKERLSRFKIPVISGLPFGHEKRNFVVPQGVKISISTAKNLMKVRF